MSNQFDISIYYATDKNIYDILNHRAVSLDFLYNFLKFKGIIVSQKADKAELVEYIKQFLIDYHDRSELLNAFTHHQAKEKKTNKKLKTEINDEQLQEVLANVKSIFSDNKECVDINVLDNNNTVVTLKYTDVDYSKTELRQKEEKEIKVTISNDGNELKIHSTANDKAYEFVNTIKKQIEQILPENTIDEIVVTLEAIKEPSKRTKFFQNLIYGMAGYTVHDVKNVYVATLGQENDDENEQQVEVAASIRRVILKGCSVINTDEYKSLKTKGFYIAKLIWTSKEKNGVSNDLFEFEAEFGNQEKCTDFKYTCNGYYSFDTDKLEYHSQRHKVPNQTERVLLDLLELSAEAALKDVQGPVEEVE